PTISNALSAAGLSVNSTSVTMVQQMMANQMSIDKNSLLEMAKTLADYPGTQVSTIVDMTKAGLPISEQSIIQFENYAQDNAAVTDKMQSMMDTVPELLSSSELTKDQAASLAKEILNIFRDTGANAEILATDRGQGASELLEQNAAPTSQAAAGPAANPASAQTNPLIIEGAPTGDNAAAATAGAAAGEAAGEAAPEGQGAPVTANLSASSQTQASSDPSAQPAAAQVNPLEVTGAEAGTADGAGEAAVSQGGASLIAGEGVMLTDQELNSQNLLNTKISLYVPTQDMQSLQSLIGDMVGSDKELLALLDENGNLKSDLTGADVMNAVSKLLEKSDSMTTDQLRSLLSNKAFTRTLSNIMSRNWLVSPQDVEVKDRMNDLYKRLDTQMERFEQAFAKVNTPGTDAVARGASDMRQNISFMNQLNQNYTYLQIPLRLMNQNTKSDLYVYSNKRSINDDGTLSAFLHLDMENLGSTDVSVKMKDMNVSTHFFFEDEKSFDLVEEHIDELTGALQKKGYNVTMKVENEERKVDFVNDFIKDGHSAGSVHRYSFDVKA
ncbi:MAG: flagellar hook-length control protein FliK, partial [Eubacterium sp.]|nr:flagellar hook-length control protein FliK [Eubacterium sp.]